MNERTVEYFLVPRAVWALGGAGMRALPFYYWSSREGSRVGVAGGDGITLKVVAIFARRPKVLDTGDEHIQVKFNHSLFRATYVGYHFSIPVLAAVPLVTSLFDLNNQARVLWCHLHPVSEEVGDIVMDVPLLEHPSSIDAGLPVQMIEEAHLGEWIQDHGTYRSWAEWADMLKEFLWDMREGRSVFSFSYTPFFVGLL